MYYHLITKDGLKQKDLSIEEIEKILREEEVNYNNARIYELCQNTRDSSTRRVLVMRSVLVYGYEWHIFCLQKI